MRTPRQLRQLRMPAERGVAYYLKIVEVNTLTDTDDSHIDRATAHAIAAAAAGAMYVGGGIPVPRYAW